jgi:hypothetical protein
MFALGLALPPLLVAVQWVPALEVMRASVRNVTLKVGSTAETVEVTGISDALVPVDSGEKSSTLTTKELQNYVQVGSNAAEFIKIMPGFGIRNGTSNKANYTGETIGINPLERHRASSGQETVSFLMTARLRHQR